MKALAGLTTDITVVVLVFVRHLRRLHLNLGLGSTSGSSLVEFECAHGYDALSALQAFRDLHVVAVADADFDFLLVRIVVGVQHDHGGRAVRGSSAARRGNHDRVGHRLGDHRDSHAGSRLQAAPGIGRLHPYFDGRAVRVQGRAHQT